MELICPSCEARYQLPQGSIGEKGRQVSCMNCGHGWHAFPPLMLGTKAQPSRAEAEGITWRGPENSEDDGGFDAPRERQPALAESPAAAASSGLPTEMTPAVGSTGPAVGADGSRSEQLAEIRQMLAEVQSEDRAAEAIAPSADVASAGSPVSLLDSDGAAERASMRLAEERADAQRSALLSEEPTDDDADQLRHRIDRHSDRAQPKPTDVKKIRRSHDRRIKRRKHAAKAGSGAFLTGFLLIAMIAAVMVALYALQPQIVARMPEAEGAMTEYVATIDSLRAQFAETFGGAIDWVAKHLGNKV